MLHFQADLVKVHREVREMMAEIYDDSSFEPISVREVTDDLPTDERAKGMT